MHFRGSGLFIGVKMATMAATRAAAAASGASLQWQQSSQKHQGHVKSMRMLSVPMGLGSSASLHLAMSPPLRAATGHNNTWGMRTVAQKRKAVGVARASSGANQSVSRPSSQPRFIQHKQEAFWFYRFLSIVYDHIINPGHWTEDMREDALEPADLNDPNLTVVDVGGGTGFTTLGIVRTVDAKNVTILDQSPHQLEKAKGKEPLKECKIIEGDAEDLPFETDYADRYVSAGRYGLFVCLG